MISSLDPEIVNMDQKFLDPEIVEMVRFLDPETAEILQFLDPEIVKMDKKISGSRNRRNGAISGSRNRRKGRQILYASMNTMNIGCLSTNLEVCTASVISREASSWLDPSP